MKIIYKQNPHAEKDRHAEDVILSGVEGLVSASQDASVIVSAVNQSAAMESPITASPFHRITKKTSYRAKSRYATPTLT